MIGWCVRRLLLAFFLWSALVVWAGAILWLSSLGAEELPRAAFMAWDKLNHFAAFAAGGWLAASAVRVSIPFLRAGTLLLAAALVVASFGAFDEMFQLLSPGRSGADLYDWIADLLGASFGAFFSLLTHGIFERLVARR